MFHSRFSSPQVKSSSEEEDFWNHIQSQTSVLPLLHQCLLHRLCHQQQLIPLHRRLLPHLLQKEYQRPSPLPLTWVVYSRSKRRKTPSSPSKINALQDTQRSSYSRWNHYWCDCSPFHYGLFLVLFSKIQKRFGFHLHPEGRQKTICGIYPYDALPGTICPSTTPTSSIGSPDVLSTASLGVCPVRTISSLSSMTSTYISLPG